MSGDGSCRADVWLWRARIFKTRSLSARFVEEGRVRIIRGGAQMRLDKASRAIKVGDGLVLAIGGRLITVKVEALGVRRGPPPEARMLYSELADSETPSEC